jgi:hypothetical protein
MAHREQMSILEISREERRQTPVHPGSAVLRRAVRGQIVSFPSQVPVFLKRPTGDLQWRIVLLYFVRGWSGPRIAARFNTPIHRIREILNSWSIRALEVGYVQVIDPEAFAACCQADHEGSEEMRICEPSLVFGDAPRPVPDAARVAAALLAPPPCGAVAHNRNAERSREMVGAQDIAIARCEEWGGEFWLRMATLLCDLRKAAAAGVELRRSKGQVDGPSTRPVMDLRDEERVSHAVA